MTDALAAYTVGEEPPARRSLAARLVGRRTPSVARLGLPRQLCLAVDGRWQGAPGGLSASSMPAAMDPSLDTFPSVDQTPITEPMCVRSGALSRYWAERRATGVLSLSGIILAAGVGAMRAADSRGCMLGCAVMPAAMLCVATGLHLLAFTIVQGSIPVVTGQQPTLDVGVGEEGLAALLSEGWVVLDWHDVLGIGCWRGYYLVATRHGLLAISRFARGAAEVAERVAGALC